jgi:DNA-binding NarL/FixJ family response regulator
MAIKAGALRVFMIGPGGLFTVGIRTLLEQMPQLVHVVGVEHGLRKGLKAVHRLRPDVLIIEEPTKQDPASFQDAVLRRAIAPTIVALSLTNNHATVYRYQNVRIPVISPAGLARAMTGV